MHRRQIDRVLQVLKIFCVPFAAVGSYMFGYADALTPEKVDISWLLVTAAFLALALIGEVMLIWDRG